MGLPVVWGAVREMAMLLRIRLRENIESNEMIVYQSKSPVYM